MIAIYKYELVSVIDLVSGPKVTNLLNLPTGARVLSVGVHKDKVCAWIILDNEAPTTNKVYVQFVGTEWPLSFPDDVPNPIFVDTVSLYNGDFIYHVFMGEVNSNWKVPFVPEPEDPIVSDAEPEDPIVSDAEPEDPIVSDAEHELEMQESDY